MEKIGEPSRKEPVELNLVPKLLFGNPCRETLFHVFAFELETEFLIQRSQTGVWERDNPPLTRLGSPVHFTSCFANHASTRR